VSLSPTIVKLLNKGLALQQAGRRREARQAYQKVLKAVPGQPDALHLMGVLALEGGHLTEAGRLISQALQQRPRDPAFLSNLGLVRRRQGRLEDAAACFRAALAAAPEFANALVPYGETLLALGRGNDALPVLERAVATQPRSARAFAALGQCLAALGRVRGAARVLRQALALDPRHLPALQALSNLPAPIVSGEEGLGLSARCVALAPADAGLRGRHALLLEYANRLEEAEETAKTALTLDAGEPQALITLARLAHRQGQPDAARSYLASLDRAALSPDLAALADWLAAQIADRAGDAAEAVAAMRRAHAHNRRTPAAQRVDPDVILQRVAWLRDWAQSQPARDAAAANPEAPVFFVGFPRSGTTLMEQVLAAHPQLVTTMEEPFLSDVLADLTEITGRDCRYPMGLPTLMEDERRTAATVYMERVRQSLGPAAEGRRVVDKLPLNLIDLPAVAALFPGADVIVALRDPRDVVVSAFMQLFAPNPAMLQLSSLEGAARFYGQVMALLPLYERCLGLRMCSYRYEDLIADFDGTVGRILKHLGLPWTDDVRRYAENAERRNIATPSYTEVIKKPHSRAIGRWMRYSEQLGSLVDDLHTWVERFGYQP